jgi:hypothetical protein
MEHFGDSDGLGDLRRRDDFDDGLEGGGRKGKPLGHDEGEEGSVVFRLEVARVELDVQRLDDLLDGVRVTAGWNQGQRTALAREDMQSKKKRKVLTDP